MKHVYFMLSIGTLLLPFFKSGNIEGAIPHISVNGPGDAENNEICHVDEQTGDIGLLRVPDTITHYRLASHSLGELSGFYPLNVGATGKGIADSDGDGIADRCQTQVQRTWAAAYTDFDPYDGPYLSNYSSGSLIAALIDNGDGIPGAGDFIRFGSFPNSVDPIDRSHRGRIFPKNNSDLICSELVTYTINVQRAVCTVDGEMWSRRFLFEKSDSFPSDGYEYYGEYWIDMAWFFPLPGGSGDARRYERLGETADEYGYLTVLADYANSSDDAVKLCSRSPSGPSTDINCSPGASPGQQRQGNDHQFIDVEFNLPR